MKIKDILKENETKFDEFEVWQYTDKTNRLHTDFIKNLDSEISMEILAEIEADDFYIMDETEYNGTILANSHFEANFSELYDDKDAKVLVIMINYKTEI